MSIDPHEEETMELPEKNQQRIQDNAENIETNTKLIYTAIVSLSLAILLAVLAINDNMNTYRNEVKKEIHNQKIQHDLFEKECRHNHK